MKAFNCKVPVKVEELIEVPRAVAVFVATGHLVGDQAPPLLFAKLRRETLQQRWHQLEELRGVHGAAAVLVTLGEHCAGALRLRLFHLIRRLQQGTVCGAAQKSVAGDMEDEETNTVRW